MVKAALLDGEGMAESRPRFKPIIPNSAEPNVHRGRFEKSFHCSSKHLPEHGQGGYEPCYDAKRVVLSGGNA